MEEIKIGFISSSKFENDSVIRGAVLITDEETKPLEFRITAPIRPTAFQRTLYGEILDEHILVELISIPLLGALGKKPDMVIVRDPLLLASNSRQDIPVIRVFKDGEPRFAGDNKSEPLSSISGKYEPILIETSKDLEPKLSELRKRLGVVFAKRSLLEPFDRIATALRILASRNLGR